VFAAVEADSLCAAVLSNSLVAAAVKSAITDVCSRLHQDLEEHNAGDELEVRVCLDEMGGSPALIRSCCGMSRDLQTTLNWGECVRIRLYAAGTGVGAVDNPGGSENTFYKLAILEAAQAPGEESQASNVYWKIRRSNLFANPLSRETRLTAALVALADGWNNLAKQRELLHERDQLLQDAMMSHAASLAKHKQLMLEPSASTSCQQIPDADGMRRLVQESVFAAVEADSLCATVLNNSRMAALIVARCVVVADGICKNQVCGRSSATNIRREVLEPAAGDFKRLNA
jgi:hypothetical protein